MQELQVLGLLGFKKECPREEMKLASSLIEAEFVLKFDSFFLEKDFHSFNMYFGWIETCLTSVTFVTLHNDLKILHEFTIYRAIFQVKGLHLIQHYFPPSPYSLKS